MEFDAPLPLVVVNVTSKKDVAAVIKYCTKTNIPFLAQNGGVGWADTFHLSENGVLINLAALNAVTIAADKKTATISSGASIGDTIAAADAAGALVLTGNCNCVGSLGAYLGGGYGNLMGELSFSVDNVISARVVNANGTILTVSPTSNSNLFWAVCGAAPNFGIVTSKRPHSLDNNALLHARQTPAARLGDPAPPSHTTATRIPRSHALGPAKRA